MALRDSAGLGELRVGGLGNLTGDPKLSKLEPKQADEALGASDDAVAEGAGSEAKGAGAACLDRVMEMRRPSNSRESCVTAS